MSKKLNIAFLWHMHQPYYRDPKTEKYILPWVRLHGLKGYTDMIAAVKKFGNVRVTFNFVPVLLKQLEDLATGKETDLYYDVSLKSPEDLKPAEKKLILKYFFSANWTNLVLKYPRYRDLLNRRGMKSKDSDLEDAAKKFSVQDFRDLQVWFNLTWCGWSAEEQYPLIGQLKRKDRNFTEGEKTQLLELQLQILSDIVPEYKKAVSSGNIEISTTPFYHPILPLIMDSQCARISQPHDPMPERFFHRVSDAKEQLQQARQYIAEQFGREPVGLWPSEGSVSPAVCELANELDFQWLATDESVLLATLSGAKREEVLYATYLAFNQGPTLIFRDRFLSDAIGFRYARNAPKRSVEDLLGHLKNIAGSLAHPENSIVGIILDGENAWESFPDGGRKFFEELYTRLTDHSQFQTCTISEYIERNPARTVLPPIFPASWINGSFRIWIGDPVKNQAWDKLATTAVFLDRQITKNSDTQILLKAQERLFIAEGSDWFWWYGEPNHSAFEEEFDYLFRSNLMEIYRDFKAEIPADLLDPIGVGGTELPTSVLFPIHPVIDGRETTFYEWAGAQEISADDFSGSMNYGSSVLKRLFYGFSDQFFYLRLDPAERFDNLNNLRILIHFGTSNHRIVEINNLHRLKSPDLKVSGEKMTPLILKAAFDSILEVEIAFEIIDQQGSALPVAVAILQENLEIERWPREGFYYCPKPTPEYLSANWLI